MRLQFSALLLISSLLIPLNAFAEAKVVQQGGPYTSNSMKIQAFNTAVYVEQADASTPLTLTITNGPRGAKAFSWVRIFLTDGSTGSNSSTPRGRMLVNETTFRHTNTAVIDMTGQFRQGSNGFFITGAGVPGASISWVLTKAGAAGDAGGGSAAGGLQITSTDPKVLPAGGEAKISGSGFSKSSKDLSVVIFQQYNQFASGPVKPSEISDTAIKFSVPKNLNPGELTLQLVMDKQKSSTFKAECRGIPEITGSSLTGGPVGTQFTIYGKNFSKNAGDNEVIMTLSGEAKDGISCSASAVSVGGKGPDSFTVTMPQFPALGDSPFFSPPKAVYVLLKVSGVPAKPANGWTIYCSRAPWVQ